MPPSKSPLPKRYCRDVCKSVTGDGFGKLAKGYKKNDNVSYLEASKTLAPLEFLDSERERLIAVPLSEAVKPLQRDLRGHGSSQAPPPSFAGSPTPKRA